MIPVVSVIGKEKETKTTTVIEIIQELHKRGYSVGAIKHHAHGDFAFDVPGKPSYRHREAGAREIAVSGPTMMGYIRQHDNELDLDEIAGFFSEKIDVIVTEGYASAKTPKIEAPVKDITETGDEIEAMIKENKGGGRE